MKQEYLSILALSKLIKSLSSLEIGWNRGLLGEKLVDDVLPCLTDEPVMAVFWGQEPHFFSRGIEGGVADAIQNQLFTPHGQANIMKSAKAENGPVFSVPMSVIAQGDPKFRMHISDEMVIAPLGKIDETISGTIAVLTRHRDTLNSEFKHAMALIAVFAGSILGFADEIDSLESFLHLTYQIVENDPSGIAICDASGKVLRANRAMAGLTGYPQAQLVGKAVSRFFQPNEYSELRDRWRSDRADSYEIFINNHAGEQVPVRLSPYRIRQKEKVWYVVQLENLRNSYELKQKEMQVERLQAVFNAAVTVQDKVNTPLTIILAHLERLRLKWKNGLSREDLDKSLGAVERQVEKITKTLSRMSELRQYKVQDYALNNRMMLDISDSTDMEHSHSSSLEPDEEEG
ncbi:MAG: PAS domain S-box protein [Acidobacteria bacterium]|nr:PAS domain S-box protein [Acidobacteriota bacterium]